MLERLPTLAIRAALTPAGETINPGELSAAEQAELVVRLRARPQAYAAQERIVPSVSPGATGRSP